MQNFLKLVKDAGIEIAYKIEDLELKVINKF